MLGFNSITMNFNPGFEIEITTNPMGFKYGQNVFGPKVENRKLDSIRKSLLNPNSDGPEIVYSIAMDVGKHEHFELLKKLNLLFGVVTYAAGKLGKEPIRSQGHIHKHSPVTGWSTPEVYEVWSGRAIIYMQESAKDNPGRCFAVEAGPGEVIIVPPGWAHATISAGAEKPLTFGAWCVRDYGFDYDEIRAHGGLAWFPVIGRQNKMEWKKNQNYIESNLIIKKPEIYTQLNIELDKSIYKQFEENPHKFDFVPQPALVENIWNNFIP